MPRAFAVEQPFPEKLRGHMAAAAFLKGAVLPDEYLMQVRGMATVFHREGEEEKASHW